MKTAQQHAQEILPLVTAQANGEVIQMYVGDEWSDCMEPTAFVDGCEYRVKPKTIKVNGFDVPAPISDAPECGGKYFIPSLRNDEFVDCHNWHGDSYDKLWLSRCQCHQTESAAIAHAKAMLGIDPNS